MSVETKETLLTQHNSYSPYPAPGNFVAGVSATDKVLGRKSSGAGVVEEIDCTAAGRALLDDITAAAQATTLGLGIADSVTHKELTLTNGLIVRADPGYEPSLWVSPSGRLAYGFSTGTPTYSLSFVGTGGQSVGMERNTSADAGQEFVIAAGGAKSGASNAAGGTLRLKGGTATGDGSSSVEIWTATAGASGTADRAATLKVSIDGAGSINIPTGATFKINGSPHTHNSFSDLAIEDLALTTAYQPSLTFYDTNAAGPAGHHKSKILYDSGVEISSVGGFVLQSLNDDGSFKANVAALWTHDKSFHWGGITRPDAAGGFQISSGKLEVVGYNIETNQQVVSTVATGTAPFTPSSTTMCPSLNSDQVDGYEGTDLAKGWIPESGTWTRVTDNTFTISGDLTSRYGVGTKLRWVQNSITRWAYVSADSTYASGTGLTTVTLYAGSDYVLTSGYAISATYYSYADAPNGFPDWFAYPVTWTGFSADPTVVMNIFRISGRMVTFYQQNVANTSNATTMTSTLPIVSPYSWVFSGGVGKDNSAALAHPSLGLVSAGSNVVTWSKDNFDAAWLDSGTKNVNIMASYRI